MSLLEDIKLELKNRIKNDMEPEGKWNAQLWTKITFGDYYGKTPERLPIIHRVVGETVDNILAKDNLQMTTNSWNGLKNAVDGSDTAETALPDMEEAAAVVEPRTGENLFFEFIAAPVFEPAAAPEKPKKSARKPKSKKTKKEKKNS